MDGKTRPVVHEEEDELFEGIPSPFTAMRYHSLVARPEGLPRDLVVTAWAGDRPRGAEIMAMKHRLFPVYGVQFHPESIGTPDGKRLWANPSFSGWSDVSLSWACAIASSSPPMPRRSPPWWSAPGSRRC